MLTVFQGSYKKALKTPPSRGISTKYPHKSCRKWVFFQGRGWNGGQSDHYDQLYKDMKQFGKAAITTFYNAQTHNTRKAWLKLEVKGQMERVLRQLLKDLHPNLECRQLLAESNKILLKHIAYQTLREFKARCMKQLEPGEYEDQGWIPEEYVYALEGSIRLLHSADDDTDSTAKDDENGLNDSFDFNAFSLFSNFGGIIEDGDAVGDWNLIPGYYTSQDSYSLSLPPIDAAFKPNFNTIAHHYDTEFSMGTSVGIRNPLPNTRTMDEDANTMDTFIPPSWNDTHWDAFIDTETSNPIEDIDTILRNATSLNAQRAVQALDMTQLSNTSLTYRIGKVVSDYGWGASLFD